MNARHGRLSGALAAGAFLMAACGPGAPSPEPEPAPAPPPEEPAPKVRAPSRLCQTTPASATIEAGGDAGAALAAAAREAGDVRVIVGLSNRATAQSVGGGQETAMAAFRAAGVEYVEPLAPGLPYMVAEMGPDELNELYADPRFPVWIEDRLAYPSLAESGPLIGTPGLFALGGRGDGQSVAVLDTGVDAAHPFFEGRVVAEACFSTSSASQGSASACPNGEGRQVGPGAAAPCAVDGCDHGTHVAGIAAGEGPDFTGVAPDAKIIAIQVFSVFSGPACGPAGGECVASFASDQIRALDYLVSIAEERALASVNMSLGGGRSPTACDQEFVKPLIDQLRTAGAATVIASGNDGFDRAVSFPACISTAVTVGATDDDDRLAPFSNCGPQIDLHAPGVRIDSAIPGGGFATLSGTSMATPQVAGAFAALRSLDPAFGVDMIEAALIETGVDGAASDRIDVLAAAEALRSGAAAGDTQAAAAPAVSTAQLQELPEDEPARFIVQLRADRETAGPGGYPVEEAEAVARAAGATDVEILATRALMIVEGPPRCVSDLAEAGLITGFQIDRVATPQ